MRIYQNLKAEMARKGLSQRDIAKALRKNETAITYKMHSKSGFTVAEAIAVKKALNLPTPIEVLFAREEI